MRIAGPFNSGIAAGGAGVATANANTPSIISGELLGAYIRYNDAPPAGTTNAVIATKGTEFPAFTLLTVTNVATNGWFRPAQQACDAVGAPVAGAYVPTLIHDYVNIKIQGANNGDSVDVWLVLE